MLMTMMKKVVMFKRKMKLFNGNVGIILLIFSLAVNVKEIKSSYKFDMDPYTLLKLLQKSCMIAPRQANRREFSLKYFQSNSLPGIDIFGQDTSLAFEWHMGKLIAKGVKMTSFELICI